VRGSRGGSQAGEEGVKEVTSTMRVVEFGFRFGSVSELKLLAHNAAVAAVPLLAQRQVGQAR
jgi:hypothetical protein